MIVMTITARYRNDADAIWADALSFDRLRVDLGGLVDYHGLPTGSVTEGQSYRFTPVLWTLFRLPEAHVTCTRIDHVAREADSVMTQTSPRGRPQITRYFTRITPDGDGALWTDRLEMADPPPGPIALRIGRYVHKAGHRRRRARAIHVQIDRH